MHIVEFFLAHQRYAVLLITLLAVGLVQLLLLLRRFGLKQSNEAMRAFFNYHFVLHALFFCSIGAATLGGLMNVAVMSLNAGRMPAVSLSQDDDGEPLSPRHRILTRDTRLPLLADRITIEGDRFIFYASIGDFLIFLGVPCFAFILVCIVPSVAVALGVPAPK